MPIHTWTTVFQPEFTSGGISALTRGTIAKLFDDFESYVSDGVLGAQWSVTNGAIGDPRLTTAANAILGRQSLQVTATGGVAVVSRPIPNNTFGFPVGSSIGRIRYINFKAVSSSGNQTIRVRLADASDATLYKEWQFVVAQDKTREFVIDLYSGSTAGLAGGGFLNSESYPGPVAEGATAWNPDLIDQISFRNLTEAITFRFDDIKFYYQYSLLDAVGFGTEPSSDDGADGSVHSKLRYLNNLVLQKIGETQQYSKYSPGYVRLNNSYTFGLELKSGLLVPNVTEINPGNYTINRIRNGVTTEIVASVAADESAGFISATYTPLEDNWQLGDLLLVTFSGGFVDKDTDTAELLTANANAGTTTITLANAALFQAGQRVRIYDDTPDTEIQVIVSIDSPTTLTVGALANNYTTAANARIVLIERTNLETARIAVNVSYEPEITAELERWVLADYDDFDFADADGNNERWDVGYIANSNGSPAGTEGGSADINTTTAGQARVGVNPDATPTQAAYALKKDTPIHSKYFSIVVDADVVLDTGYVTSTLAGLRVSAGDIDDPNNYILIAREAFNTANRITARAEFMGVGQATVNANTTDNAVAFKIERYENVWNIFYSLTQYPNWIWTKLTQYEDANGDMTGSVSVYLYAESGGSNDAQIVTVDFDNWKYYIGSGAIDQLLSTSILATGTFTASSATVPADTGRLEENDYWNGAILMPITGVVAFQPRLIVDFANAGGVFTAPSSRPFTTAPAVGDEYAILAYQGVVNPALNTTTDQTMWDVVGTKADTVVPVSGTTASLAGYVKALIARGMGIIQGVVSSEEAGLQTTQFYSTDLIGFGNDYFNEEFSLQVIYTTDGAAPLGETRDISDYVSTDGHFIVASVFSAGVNTGDKIVILHKTQLLLIPTIDTSDPVDMTAEVPDNSVLAHLLTDDGDTSVFDRRRMSLEAISNALGIVNPGGTGFDGDGTGTTAYEAVVGSVEATWMDGTAQQALSDMPFVQGILHIQQNPRVDQSSQIVAVLSLHNLRPDSDVIQTTEYSGTTVTISRYRQGVDAGWTDIIVAAAMAEAAGQATYAYTFTSASWAAGDSIRYTVQSCVVEIPTASGQIFTLPVLTGYGVVSASSISSNALALPIFAEFWETETIEADVWTTTTPVTGTLAIDATEAGRMKVGISPNANETGRLISDFRVRVAPDQVGTNSIAKKLVVEFEAKFTNIANIDNSLSFFGLSEIVGATRATNNIVAFTLTGDALFATTDDAAVENNAAAGAPTLTNWNKFKIEVYAGTIDFYVNEVRTNTFIANLPDQMMYLNSYIDTEAGGAGTFDMGPIRYWYLDIL